MFTNNTGAVGHRSTISKSNGTTVYINKPDELIQGTWCGG